MRGRICVLATLYQKRRAGQHKCLSLGILAAARGQPHPKHSGTPARVSSSAWLIFIATPLGTGITHASHRGRPCHLPRPPSRLNVYRGGIRRHGVPPNGGADSGAICSPPVSASCLGVALAKTEPPSLPPIIAHQSRPFQKNNWDTCVILNVFFESKPPDASKWYEHGETHYHQYAVP